MTEEISKLGGWTQEEVVTPEVEKICREVKSNIKDKLKIQDFKAYTPLTFRSQLVNGTNYLVKVFVDVDKCVHATIFAALPSSGGKLIVTAAQIVPLGAPLLAFE